jgi:hypothetical protein
MTLNRIRTFALLAATTGVLSAGALGFVVPATATSGDSVTINNAASVTVRTNHTLAVAATAQPTCQAVLGVAATSRSVTLELTGPGSSSKTIASSSQPCDQTATLKATLGAPKHNGSYTVTLENGSATNTTTATADVLIPPARVKRLVVSTGGTVATFSWKPDATRDVTAYQILRSTGRVAESLSAAHACGRKSAHCVTSVDLGLAVAGTSQTFSVRGLRCGLSCSGKKVPGATSRSVMATFAAPVAPTPPPEPTTEGASGPSGSTRGGHLPGSHTGTPPAASTPPSQPAPSAASDPPTTSLAPTPAGGATHPASAAPSAMPITLTGGASSTDSAPWRWIGAAAVMLLIVAHVGALITRRS